MPLLILSKPTFVTFWCQLLSYCNKFKLSPNACDMSATRSVHGICLSGQSRLVFSSRLENCDACISRKNAAMMQYKFVNAFYFGTRNSHHASKYIWSHLLVLICYRTGSKTWSTQENQQNA